MSEISPINTAAERYRFNRQAVRVNVGDGLELFHCDLTGANALVAGHEARIVQACQQFATLDDHARQVCSQLGFGSLHLASIRQQLEKFAEAGLLVPHCQLIAKCSSVGTQSTENTQSTNGTTGTNGITAKIEKLGVLTRNRPQPLKRCLESYASLARDTCRDVSYVIADQSDKEHRSHNIEILKSLKTDLNAQIWHIDVETAHTIAAKLSRICAVPLELIEFALLGTGDVPFAGGANRNLLLLSSVGELILQSDDDSACRVIPAPNMESGLTLSSSVDPAEFWFPSETEMKALEAGFKNEDLFAMHERLLGKTVSQLVLESDSKTNIDDTAASFYRRLGGQHQKIIVTNAGLVGESGRGGGQPILLLDGEKRKRLIVSQEHYKYVQTTQRLLRGVTRETITEGAVCFGFNLGLDNREIIPPFMPVLRGEDSIFTPVFRAATSSGFFGMLPWLVYHEGAGEKLRPTQIQAKKVSRLVFADIVGLILQAFQARTFESETGDRLGSIRDMFVELGSLQPLEFERVLRSIWWQTAAIQISKIEAALKLYLKLPEFWSKDVVEYVTEYRNNLVSRSSLIAVDVENVYGETEAFGKQQQLLRQFGELLGAWPELRMAAVELREREGFGVQI